MRHFESAIAALFILGLGTIPAAADACSGKDHYIGTGVGAVAGGLAAGLASKDVAVGLAGAAVGGFAGNYAERSMDCAAHDSKGTANKPKAKKKVARK